ncbi:MAG: hypothetical protein U9N32_02435 [Spirochaetota bacterium]|nr:hypothetical protein [Spirochaetota bacterium]
MFKNLGDKLTEKIGEIGDSIKDAIKTQSTPLDLSKFNNPIAEQTEWTPLKPGGSNFRTHEFSKKTGMAYFKATKGNLLFSGAFMFLGTVVPVLMLVSTVRNGSTFEPLLLVMNMVPLVFFFAGFFLYKHSTKPIIFSKTRGYFWKGRLKENESPEQKGLKEYCRLTDIVALQIIAEHISGSSSSSGSSQSYRSYEINLVLRDAGRLNVIDHGRKIKLLEDAEKLASYLGVPVWLGRI